MNLSSFSALSLLILSISSVHAAGNYHISDSKCVAWSPRIIKGDYEFSFTPSVPYGGGIQTSFIANHRKGLDQSHIDTIITEIVNNRKITFAVQGHGSTILFRPQDKIDTVYILESAATGSITFYGMTFKTGGTRKTVDYMLTSCKS